MPKSKTPAAKAARSKTAQAAPSAPAVLVTPIADFIQLNEDDRKIRFAEKAQVNRVSFSELGKLHFLIAADLAAWNAANPKKKPRTIYKVLAEAGVSPKSVSNAEYASRIWRELVAPGHLDEAAFDRLTFQDCFAIARAMSDRSVLPLDGAAVAELIGKQPQDFDDELRSLYAHGVTVAEKTAQDEQAEADRLKALLAAQKPAKAEKSEVGSRKSEATDAAPTASEEAPADAADTTTPPADQAPPTNITQLPPQTAAPDANLAAMIDVLDEIVNESAGFTPEGQQALIDKLDSARNAIFARTHAPAVATAA